MGQRKGLRRKVFNEFLEKKEISRKDVVANAGVSQTTITHAFTVGCSPDFIDKILTKGFKLPLTQEETERIVCWPDDDKSQTPPSLHPYTFREVIEEAKWIGKRVFDDFRPDAVLTFPGDGLIFAGLAMTQALSATERIRVPVYTVRLVTKGSPAISGFRAVSTKPKNPDKEFTVLVPNPLIEDDPDRQRKIAIIDDTIISGVTMDALRDDFYNNLGYAKPNIQVACCVCYEARTFDYEQPPDIYRLVSPEPKFEMPWGPSFCFEEFAP
jgi:adenine/guanine phosphoribosyltransferase-like PRPP-binding protein